MSVGAQARRPAIAPKDEREPSIALPTGEPGLQQPPRHVFPIVMIALGLAGSAAWVFMLLWMIVAVAVDSWS